MTHPQLPRRLDYYALLQEAEHNELDVERNEDEVAAINSNDITKEHFKRSNKLENDFLNAIANIMTRNGKQKWATLLAEVENPFFRATRKHRTCKKEMVPLLVTACAGEREKEKLELTNALIVDWFIQMKKVRLPKNGKECPWYAPSSQNMQLRTFLSHMNKTYGWPWKQSDFTGWDGCLNGVMKELYNQRYEKWVSWCNDSNILY